jgi:SAM-dependent methyltransferase
MAHNRVLSAPFHEPSLAGTVPEQRPAICGILFLDGPPRTRTGENPGSVSPVLLRVKDLVPQSAKRAVPSRVKDAIFHGLLRIEVAWQLLRRRRSRFVTRYLGGLRGVEIGAASHNPFYLDAINVDRYSDDQTIYKKLERRLSGKAARVDVVAHGDDLPFADASYDFVFSSHVIEHFPDPIKALREWVRVASRYVVAIVPHRDRTFDSERELTTVDELMERHRDGLTSEEDKHWSVWTCESFVEMCEAVGLSVVDFQDPDDKVGNGFTVVIDARAGVIAPAVDVGRAEGAGRQASRVAPLRRA